MFVTNWISPTKIQKISEITNFFRHYFLSRTEVYSYDTPYSNETENGTFEYFPNRYMFVTYYTNDWGQGDWKEENIIYTIVKITEDELILNNNGHSDIIIFKRK